VAAGAVAALIVVLVLVSGGTSSPVNVRLPKASHPFTATAAEPEVSEVFTTTNGTWLHSPTSFSYQWQRCAEAGGSCVNIGGATANKYTAVEADVSHRLRVGVTAKNAGGEATAFSGETGIVPALLVAEAPPKMKAGIVAQGTVLELSSTGEWAETPTTLAYKWERCKDAEPNGLAEPECVAISSATSSTYTPVAADAGFSIRAKVIAKKTGKLGSAVTGYTVGVEPKYGRMFASDNFWNQKLPKSGEQLITEPERYAKGIEEDHAKGNPTVQNEPNTTPFYFVPAGLTTHKQKYTGGKNIKAEVESALATVPLVPWVTGAKVNTGSTPGNPDKHSTILQVNNGTIEGEWDMQHTEPEVTSQVSSTTAVAGKVFHVTESLAKGFEVGARVDFDFVQASVTTPRPGVVYYVVGTPTEGSFELSATPGGTPIEVAGHAIEATTNTKVGVLNDVRRWAQGGALANASVYKPGYFEEEIVEGSWSPSPFNKEMWRWGSTTAGQPRAAGIITYEDFRKVAAAKTCLETEAGTGANKCHPIEHALVNAMLVRKEHILNGAVSEGAPCTPGSCWSGNMKTDAEGTTPTTWTCYETPGEEGKCFKPREGEHWRLKESTDCKKTKAGSTAKPVQRAICEALKEYGAVITDRSESQFQLYAQEAESLIDATAFTSFNPYTAGPKFYEELGGLTIGKEIPMTGNVEVMKAVEYCGGSGVGILKEVEGKTLAVKEGSESGGVKCQRPTNIE